MGLTAEITNWNYLICFFQTGIFSGLPHLMRVSFAYVFSLYADYLLRTDKMSRTNVRKLATGICKLLLGGVIYLNKIELRTV